MPIVRTYGCGECNYVWEVTLSGEAWDAPAPSCPACDARETNQQFQPPRINGSPGARANAIAENIMANDYGVSNYQKPDPRDSRVPKVAYKDDMMGVAKRRGRDWSNAPPSTWGSTSAAFQQATASGRQIRQQFGDGLDVLRSCLRDGSQPDLIANSKRVSSKVW